MEGVKGACEVLGQAVVGWAVGGRAEGPRVSKGRVAGGRLFSQTASELLVAALSVRFPAKVQLREAGVLIRPGPPLTPPQIHQVGPELGQDWGEVGCEGVPTGSAQTPGQRQLRRGARTLPGPQPSAPPCRGSKATAHPISPRSLCAFNPIPLPPPGEPYKHRASHTPGSWAGVP